MTKIPFLKKPSPDIRGFDGLMMMSTIASTAMCVGYLYSMYRSYLPYFRQEGFSFSAKTSQAYDVFRTYEFFSYIVIVIILALTAVLLFKENRYLIKFVNITYPVYILIFIVVYIIGANVLDTKFDADFFFSLFQALLFPVLILIYINKSLRIRNTIFNKEIDYVKLAKSRKSAKKQKTGTLKTMWDKANKQVKNKK